MTAIEMVSWNVNRSPEAWRVLAVSGIDVALLQEAQAPPAALRNVVRTDSQPWTTGLGRPWRACVAGFSDRIGLREIPLASLGARTGTALGVSRLGTLAAAEVTIKKTQAAFTVVSLYGAWEKPAAEGRSWIYADAAVHRLISDLSALITTQKGHRIIAAGDLNILYGHGEAGSRYWQERYATVFTRMEALGLRFVGPQAPAGGAQASPWPEELPCGSRNVPTFRTNIHHAESATRQLDFVFASASIAPLVRVRALNGLDEWGPSDHCRVAIEVST
ncbi:MAG: endonuclease/exonuclease/phosphatase family protein [Thermoleophilia bacterium]